jgi:hypothetical protein
MAVTFILEAVTYPGATDVRVEGRGSRSGP